MTKSEYLNEVRYCDIEAETVEKIEKKYRCNLIEDLKRIVSFNADSIFFEDGCRSLSTEEILDADNDLHIDFSNRNIIPIIDCGENDFIVYHSANCNWSKFNVIDESVFKNRKTLDELL